MRTRFLAILVCALPLVSTAAVVYKWVDKDGVTHFSDQPFPGAQKMTVEAAQTYSAPPTPISAGVSPKPAASGKPYNLCEIATPMTDQVFFSVQSVPARVRIQPQLRGDDRVVVVYDGKRTPEIAAPGGQFTLSPTYRGTHTVAAVVENSQGAPQCEAPPVTFHVRQPSIVAPNRAPSARH